MRWDVSHLSQAPLAKLGVKLKIFFSKSKMYKVSKESLERVATLNLKWRKLLLLLLCLVDSPCSTNFQFKCNISKLKFKFELKMAQAAPAAALPRWLHCSTNFIC